jgi:hypothetical protein
LDCDPGKKKGVSFLEYRMMACPCFLEHCLDCIIPSITVKTNMAAVERQRYAAIVKTRIFNKITVKVTRYQCKHIKHHIIDRKSHEYLHHSVNGVIKTEFMLLFAEIFYEELWHGKHRKMESTNIREM